MQHTINFNACACLYPVFPKKIAPTTLEGCESGDITEGGEGGEGEEG
ncbi:MAG: hypothetical protein WBF90_20585 [Rivularia sp. (in: cyanobacteria)]|jgi:hypothetical protein